MKSRHNRSFFSRLSPEGWLIREEGWEENRQNHYATVLALGNGRVGSRSILEESPRHATSGTYLAGVFDAAGSVVDDPVNLPNFFELRIFVNGQALSVDTLPVIAHERVLDMRRGVLLRRTVFRGGRGGRFELRTERFLSRAEPCAAILRATFSSVDGDFDAMVSGDFGLGEVNTDSTWEGRKRHYAVEAIRPGKKCSFLRARMLESGIGVGYAWTTLVRSRPVLPAEPLRMKLRKGRPVSLARVAWTASSLDFPAASLERNCTLGLAGILRRGLPAALSAHERAWAKLWDVSAVSLAGAPKLERAALFNIYHLLICGTDSGTPAGIGAKSMTGEGYRGHSFWDTEIYTLPFYVMNHPGMARQLVRYRLDRLDAAKANARSRGYRGALFPWESGRTGSEVTPWFPLDDGSLYLFETGKYQHHITSDVAWGLVNYWQNTGDDALMNPRGLELLVETARFWASRVEWNRRKGRYEINEVIGPDEYHVAINNNSYTNCLARWNLETAAELLARLGNSRLGVTGREMTEWRRIAPLIANTEFGGGKLVEQFDGYFRLWDPRITRQNRHGMPVRPRGVTGDNMQKTQLSKQADVVLVMMMFPGKFTPEQKILNFNYYQARTLHESSLSACTYARAGLEFGAGSHALRYLATSLFTDLNDVQGNTDKGMHIASCGGNWQTLIRGFGGAVVTDGRLSISPRVPREWKRMRYSLRWRGALLRVDATPSSVVVRNDGPAPVSLEIFGHPVDLSPRSSANFPRR